MEHTPTPPAPLFGNVVNEYYVDKIRKSDAARAKRLRAIRTKADARRYVDALRRKITQISASRRARPSTPW